MERDLVRRAQAGDKEAFTMLASTLTDGLFAVAYRMLRDSGLAEDATQQALLDAWRKLPQLRDLDRIEAWIHRLLINVCKDEIGRSRSREAKLQLLRGPERSTPDEAIAVEQRDQLERAFARLSHEHRAVVVLRHYLFWSPEEIGQALWAASRHGRLALALRDECAPRRDRSGCQTTRRQRHGRRPLMTRQHDSTSLVEEWLSDGPDVAPDRVLAEVAGKLGRTRQEGTFLMYGFGRVGVFATAAAVAVGRCSSAIS